MPAINDTQKAQILAQSKVIVIIGLSPDPTKPSHRVAAYLQEQGYSIIPIYPKGGKILGQEAFPTLQECVLSLRAQNIDIDIINIFRKSEALPQIAQEILELKLKPKCVWVQLGLHNASANAMLTQAGIAYEEDSCIKLEHQRLC